MGRQIRIFRLKAIVRRIICLPERKMGPIISNGNTASAKTL
ncbi:hypothetical protein BN1012_Phect2339 [Candidatus Phaeomarinobacter ectocarpi]|uniref:Uncharacterized protein n=1 Tax=Candidatus Phaeomarinibacter ectocarpi TaxID=1458461 RepID=X5MDX6_9HYPH|nr:hypothetical protein BN1012_Phect2339 [Candidatus Phaeomarinobacter ectocarpi]